MCHHKPMLIVLSYYIGIEQHYTIHTYIVFFVDLITKSLRSNNAWERTRLKASVIDAYFTKTPQNSHFVHDHTTTRYPNKISFLHLELFCNIAPQSRKTPCWRFLIQSQNQNKKFLRTSEIFFLKSTGISLSKCFIIKFTTSSIKSYFDGLFS